MDELTQAIIRARSANSEARQYWASLKEELDFVEASLFLGCDYKALGPNEETRKAAFKVNVLWADDTRYVPLKRQLSDAETEKESTGVVLENLLDQRRAYENQLRAEFIKGRYGVIVAVELNDDYGDFELSVMAETYFENL